MGTSKKQMELEAAAAAAAKQIDKKQQQLDTYSKVKRGLKEAAISQGVDTALDTASAFVGEVGKDYVGKAVSVIKWACIGAIATVCPPAAVAIGIFDQLIPSKYKKQALGFISDKLKQFGGWLFDKVKEKAGSWFKKKLGKFFGVEEDTPKEQTEAQFSERIPEVTEKDITDRNVHVEDMHRRYNELGHEQFLQQAVARPEPQPVHGDAEVAPEAPDPFKVNFTWISKNTLPMLLALMDAGATIEPLQGQSLEMHGEGISVEFASEEHARDIIRLLAEQGARFRAEYDLGNPVVTGGHFYSPGYVDGNADYKGLLLERAQVELVDELVCTYQPDVRQLIAEEAEYQKFYADLESALMKEPQFQQAMLEATGDELDFSSMSLETVSVVQAFQGLGSLEQLISTGFASSPLDALPVDETGVQYGDGQSSISKRPW